jgi:hypothetical protein
MNYDCAYYRERIARGSLGDLEPDEQRQLDLHLASCSACARERDLYAETFRQIRSLEDIPAPRHFFVYPEKRGTSLWQLFRMLHPAWQAAAAVLEAATVLLSAFSASRFQARAENGVYTFAFGSLPPARVEPAPARALETSALEARILQIVEAKTRAENLECVRRLRAEITRSQRRFTEPQQAILTIALTNLEARMNGRIEETSRSLADRNDRSVADLYRTIARQREMDLAAVDGRLTRLAVHDEMKSTQTDAILETLLQVAELKMK